MEGYLDVDGVAQRLGVKPRTVHRYNATGQMPEPDDHAGRSPVWLEKTIEAWLESRPGYGWRKGQGKNE